MKLISWNVNGIRACSQKEGFETVFHMKPDFLLLQETKADSTKLDPELLSKDGYYSYFESSKTKKGYSGVAIYTKHEPNAVIFGLGEEEFDDQGRVIIAEYSDYVVVSVYVPNGGSERASLEYKMRFYDVFYAKLMEYRNSGKKVIVGGDFNICHQEIDIARPKENKNNIGFLPEERERLTQFFGETYENFADALRYLHPEMTEVYTWWSYYGSARVRNVGWRIDYFAVSHETAPLITSYTNHSNILGSDHCPIEITLSLKP